MVSKVTGWISTKTWEEKEKTCKDQKALSKKCLRTKYNTRFKISNLVSWRYVGTFPSKNKCSPKKGRCTRSSVELDITKKCSIFENECHVVFENDKKEYFSANVLHCISETSPDQVLSKNSNNQLVMKPSSLKLMKDNDIEVATATFAKSSSSVSK